MIQVSAALIATLSAETGLIKGRLGQSLDRSQSRGAQDDTDEMDRTLEDWDELRTSNAENEVEGEFVREDGLMERTDWRRARTRRTVGHQRKSTRTSSMTWPS